MWDQIKRVIEEVNEEVMGGEKTAPINRKQELFDKECKEIIIKNEARRKVLQKETRSNIEKYRELRREAKKLCKKKMEHLKKQMEETEILDKQSEIRKFYNAIEKMNKGYKPKAEGCKDKDGKVINSKEGVVKRWQEHFSILLNKGDLNMKYMKYNSNYHYEKNIGRQLERVRCRKKEERH
jgi:hypothetical protein